MEDAGTLGAGQRPSCRSPRNTRFQSPAVAPAQARWRPGVALEKALAIGGQVSGARAWPMPSPAGARKSLAGGIADFIPRTSRRSDPSRPKADPAQKDSRTIHRPRVPFPCRAAGQEMIAAEYAKRGGEQGFPLGSDLAGPWPLAVASGRGRGSESRQGRWIRP